MGVEIIVPLGAFATAIILAVGVPLARAYSRKMDAESKNPRIPSEVTGRLERIEQSLEAVAIEVERITEGQRFTTKLLSEGRGVGDGPNIRRMVGALLSGEGYEVVETPSGTEAIARVKEGEPEVALVDLMMPGELDGMGTLGRLRG